MKKLIFFSIVIAMVIGCSVKQSQPVVKEKTTFKNDTIRIANDALEYEIMIIEPGFDTWLASTAKPRNFYSITYLENKNYLFVTEWNSRVLQPQRYGRDLYEMRIDYQPQIHYGYEVNYLLYNYFIFFQNRYKQKLY